MKNKNKIKLWKIKQKLWEMIDIHQSEKILELKENENYLLSKYMNLVIESEGPDFLHYANHKQSEIAFTKKEVQTLKKISEKFE